MIFQLKAICQLSHLRNKSNFMSCFYILALVGPVLFVSTIQSIIAFPKTVILLLNSARSATFAAASELPLRIEIDVIQKLFYLFQLNSALLFTAAQLLHFLHKLISIFWRLLFEVIIAIGVALIFSYLFLKPNTLTWVVSYKRCLLIVVRTCFNCKCDWDS